VNIVNIVDAANRQVEVAFSQSTKFPIRQRWVRQDPATKQQIEEITYFDKFRDAGGGVYWPFVLRRERNGHRISELYLDDIQVNQGLTDELFTLSAATKLLDKKPARKK
jgi:hypothetical protein